MFRESYFLFPFAASSCRVLADGEKVEGHGFRFEILSCSSAFENRGP